MAGLLWYRSYMDSLANTSGYYPDIHAGHADRVTELTLEAPYLVRETPAGYNQLELSQIIGGTVAWNQLCGTTSSTATSHGITVIRSTDGTCTLSGTADASGFSGNLSQSAVSATDHIFYIRGCPSGGSSSTYYLRDGYTASSDRFDTGAGNLVKGLANTILQMVIKPNYAIDGTLVFKPQLIDLTSFFSDPTIADYAYALEQQSAGSGIAWLQQYGYFTEDYIAYSAATLQSVEATAHVTNDANNTTIATYPLDSDLVLRGIPKLDNGNLYYDGDTYEWDGTVTRRFAEVDLGSLDWVRVSSGGVYAFRASVSDALVLTSTTAESGIMCAKYLFSHTQSSQASLLSTLDDKKIGRITNNTNFYIRDDSYTDKDTFTTAVTGIKMQYLLATPTTESADPFTAVQTVEDGGTEEFVTSNNVPVGNVSVYRRA